MNEKKLNTTSDYFLSEALEIIKRLELQTGPGEAASDRAIELENIRALVLNLAAEIGNLQHYNDRLTDRFNRMYFVMTAVWERLGLKKGTWEERLEQVRFWAREPERAMNRRILAAAGKLQSSRNCSGGEGEEAAEERNDHGDKS